jgi:hypothetical protein
MAELSPIRENKLLWNGLAERWTVTQMRPHLSVRQRLRYFGVIATFLIVTAGVLPTFKTIH